MSHQLSDTVSEMSLLALHATELSTIPTILLQRFPSKYMVRSLESVNTHGTGQTQGQGQYRTVTKVQRQKNKIKQEHFYPEIRGQILLEQPIRSLAIAESFYLPPWISQFPCQQNWGKGTSCPYALCLEF